MEGMLGDVLKSSLKPAPSCPHYPEKNIERNGQPTVNIY